MDFNSVGNKGNTEDKPALIVLLPSARSATLLVAGSSNKFGKITKYENCIV